jgi:hypothetical protein
MSYTIQSEYDAREQYNDRLNECYPEVVLGYSTFSPSDILRRMDPTCYEIGFTEYCDSMADDGYYVEGYTDDRMEPEEVEEE